MTSNADTWVALLGVKGGPAIKPGSNMPTSSLLRMGGKVVLVDAGLGVTRGVCDQGLDLTGIDLILITHLHSDHYLELGPFLHTAWTAGRKTPITVIGPPGLDHYWQAFLDSMQFDIRLRIEDEGRPDLANMVTLQNIDEGVVLESGPVKITAMRNLHPPIADSFALCFEDGQKKIVFSGDTTSCDALTPFASGADLLVHEVLLKSGVDRLCAEMGYAGDQLKNHLLRSHTDAPDVGRIARDAHVKHLALHHFVPGSDHLITEEHWVDAIRQTWDGPITLGQDGLRIGV